MPGPNRNASLNQRAFKRALTRDQQQIRESYDLVSRTRKYGKSHGINTPSYIKSKRYTYRKKISTIA